MKNKETLLLLCKKEPLFSINGELYFGNRILLIEDYIKQNPSIKFRTWLISKNKRVELNNY